VVLLVIVLLVVVVVVVVVAVVVVVVVVVVPQFSAGFGSGSKRPYLKDGGYIYFVETCYQSTGHHLSDYSFFRKYFEKKNSSVKYEVSTF